mgnify:CR=1 FL=1
MESIKEVYKAVTGSHTSDNRNVINIVCQSSDSMIITLAENQVIEKPAQAQLLFFMLMQENWYTR